MIFLKQKYLLNIKFFLKKMNINKNNKTQPDISPQSKSFLVISSYYQIDTLFHLLKSNPKLINIKDQKNETLLSYAIKRKNIENAELILTSKLLDYVIMTFFIYTIVPI